MIRIVAIALLVPAAWVALRWAVHFVRRRDVDWNGVAFAAGFVALALGLRSATGIG